MLNSLADHPAFQGSAVQQSLAQSPFGFIDIGARGGVHPLIAPIAKMAAVMGFEPDPPEFERLTNEAKQWPFATTKIVQTALADRAGQASLYLTRNPNNISLLKPAGDFYQRYGNPGLDVTGEINIATRTLDEVLYSGDVGPQPWGELLKVDAQGADYLILQHTERALRERVVAVVCEACFIELYEGQKLFADIELLLRNFGFSFYGFLEINMRSRRLLDKKSTRGRERLFWVDAVFFKDPIAASGKGPKLTERQLHALFVSAILCGYFDFALELAREYWAHGAEEGRVRTLIEDLARRSASAAAADVDALARIVKAEPENANLHVGRFVDERRTFFDVRDVPKA